MPRLPLDQEQHLDIAPLRGQQGRRPQTAVEPGKAAKADNTFHQGMVLSRAPGNRKLIDTPIPGACYEVGGLQRGFIQLPKDPAHDYEGSDWAVEGTFKVLELGRIAESGTQRRIFFTTGMDNQQLSNMTAEGQSVRVALQTDGDNFVFQLLWGNSASADLPLTLGGGPAEIDLDDWIKIHVAWDVSAETVTLTVRQPQTDPGTATVSIARVAESPPARPPVQFFSLGGRPSIFSPWFGHRDVLKCAVTEFRHYDDVSGGNKDEHTRLVPGAASTGFEGRLRGNRVHRELLTEPIGSGDGHAIYMSGTGAILIPESYRYRKPPGDDENTDVPGYYLERDELTVGFWFALRAFRWT